MSQVATINIVIPETNAKGWHRWALVEIETKDVMRVEYKSEDEVDADNKILGKILSKDGKQSRIWILNTIVEK